MDPAGTGSSTNQVTTYLFEDPVDANRNTSQIYPDSTDTTSSGTYFFFTHLDHQSAAAPRLRPFRRLPFFLPPFPRRRWVRIGPESPSMLAGVGVRGREFSRLVVLDVPPGKAVADHLHVDKPAAQINAADFPLVRSMSITSTRTVCWKPLSPSASRAVVPNAWRFSGASIPASRILCWVLASSRTVSVSPSLIAAVTAMLPGPKDTRWSVPGRSSKRVTATAGPFHTPL
jgi:hypothetical protein